MSTIHFAHANGFPMGSYKTLLAQLEEQFSIQGVSHIGHDPRWPVNHNWDALVDEQLAQISTNAEPVWGIGHSLGGVLLYRAALKSPAYFKGLVLLDPPLYINGLRPYMLKLAKYFNRIDRVTPARQSRARKQSWPSITAMQTYLESRSLFANFDPRCLADYISAASNDVKSERVLNFKPQIEYDIFCNLADNLSNTAPKIKVPVAVVTSTINSVIPPSSLKGFKKAGFSCDTHKGDHLFPFQYPESTAEHIQAMIEQLKAD